MRALAAALAHALQACCDKRGRSWDVQSSLLLEEMMWSCTAAGLGATGWSECH